MILKYDKPEKTRIDSYLSEVLEDMSRSHIQKKIREGAITVFGKPVKSGFLLSQGDEIALPEEEEAEPMEAEPEDIPLDIVYEDQDVIVINKPKGMVVHPAAGHATGTLVNALLYHCGSSLSGINGILRPGIVHRIDKDTTGLLMVCKNDAAHTALSEQLAVHSITRRYLALVRGNIRQEEGTVDLPIARSDKDRKKMAVASPGKGRRAVTHFRVLEHFRDAALLECRLETGRTHQIRVHMKSLGHPILGDPIYSRPDPSWPDVGLCLHALRLSFDHPVSGVRMSFTAPLPQRIREVVRLMRGLPRSPEGRG